jgi:hypothetical protein
MQYVCLVYGNPEAFDRLTEDEAAALDRASLDNDAELREAGNLVVARALEPVEEAMTVRVRDGRMSATAGPFAETAEHVGGFLLIEARDLNEAVQIAGRVPVARYGSIEVRPVLDLEARARAFEGG